MKCKEIKDHIISVPRSDRADKKSDAISEHIKICPRCRSLIEEKEILYRVAEQSEWAPTGIYWNSLLPRINLRIARKSEKTVPGWVYHVFAPVVGAILIFLVSVFIYRVQSGGPDDLLRNISVGEIDGYIQSQTTENPNNIANIKASDALDDEDVIIIKDLLNKEQNVASYYEEKSGSILETINTDEAERLFALLNDEIK